MRQAEHHDVHAADPANWALLLAAGALAAEPAYWLVRTWWDPVYDSPGGWIFVVVAALTAWSLTSPRAGAADNTRHAWWLLGATAVVRLAGHFLAISVLGALALAVDVYALGVLAGLDRRRRTVSPFWLAVLFCFCLPVERIVQRVIGYALQHVSAAGACSLLKVGYTDLQCAGVEILVEDQSVLVDLPCSGARGLVLFSVLFAGLAALVRPDVREATVGVATATVAALVANSLRIAALAVGIVEAPSLGIDVMEQPWHDAVGLAALAVGLVPPTLWALTVDGAPSPADSNSGSSETAHRSYVVDRDVDEVRPALRWLGAALLTATAAVATLAPHHPVDVAPSTDPIDLPRRLDSHPRLPREPDDFEKRYFERYGGSVAKADYGPHTLLVVETAAPLRHLHAPDECLGGAGYDVDALGRTDGPLPAARYRATAPDGSRWHVDVTYVSERGGIATSVAEAVWHWLHRPDTTWRAIQRFHLHGIPPVQKRRMDRQIAAHFDLAPRTSARSSHDPAASPSDDRSFALESPLEHGSNP